MFYLRYRWKNPNRNCVFRFKRAAFHFVRITRKTAENSRMMSLAGRDDLANILFEKKKTERNVFKARLVTKFVPVVFRLWFECHQQLS